MDTDCNTNPGAMRLVNFRVEVDLFDRFRDLAFANHRTVSQELRFLMDAHTSQTPDETPEQRHHRELHDGTLTVIPPGGDPREKAA
jgi:hypothetical protein